MDEEQGGEDQPKQAKYLVHPCLKCGRLLYMVIGAVNWCGGCSEPNCCERKDDDYDGQDEEEG